MLRAFLRNRPLLSCIGALTILVAGCGEAAEPARPTPTTAAIESPLPTELPAEARAQPTEDLPETREVVEWAYIDDLGFALVDGARSGDVLIVTLAVRAEEDTAYIGCGLQFGASDDHGNTYWPNEAWVTPTVGAFGPLPGFKLPRGATFLTTVEIPEIPEVAVLDAILVGGTCATAEVAALSLNADATWPVRMPLRTAVDGNGVLPDWLGLDVQPVGEWLPLDEYFSFKVDNITWDDGWVDLEVTFKNEDYQQRYVPSGQLAVLSPRGDLAVMYDSRSHAPGYAMWVARNGLPLSPASVGALSEIRVVISTYSGIDAFPSDGLGVLISLSSGQARDNEQTYALQVRAEELTDQAATSVTLEAGARVRIRATGGCVTSRTPPDGVDFILDCLPAGTLGVIEEGPRLDGEGRDWWKLRERDWVQGYWLRGDWR